MKYLFFYITLLLVSCHPNKIEEKSDILQESNKDKLQVLLIGSSHWNNYQSEGLDVVQTNEVDILSKQYQNDLELIVSKIKAFNPDKIFVERTINYQPKLDSLYNLYKTTNWGDRRRNEIYQLGFRTAKMLGHQRVYGVDHRNTSFPYDSLIKTMKKAGQTKLITAFNEDIEQYEKTFNTFISEKKSLQEILYFLNDKQQRKSNFDWYLSGANKGGGINENVGSFLTAEWVKRNIYIYGSIQKYTEPKDQRIMVLMGAGHIAVLESLMSQSSSMQIIELKDLMND